MDGKWGRPRKVVTKPVSLPEFHDSGTGKSGDSGSTVGKAKLKGLTGDLKGKGAVNLDSSSVVPLQPRVLDEDVIVDDALLSKKTILSWADVVEKDKSSVSPNVGKLDAVKGLRQKKSQDLDLHPSRNHPQIASQPTIPQTKSPKPAFSNTQFVFTNNADVKRNGNPYHRHWRKTKEERESREIWCFGENEMEGFGLDTETQTPWPLLCQFAPESSRSSRRLQEKDMDR
ncbi:hypothetical protein Droror1_Dr00026626 [Drosera rotundifolia]